MPSGDSCASPDLHRGISFDLEITRMLLLKQDYEKAVLDYKLSIALGRLGEEPKEIVLRKGLVVQETERVLQREIDSFKYYE